MQPIETREPYDIAVSATKVLCTIKTYKAVILTANCLGAASGTTAHTYNSDGRAVKAEECVNILDHNSDGCKDRFSGSGIRL